MSAGHAAAPPRMPGERSTQSVEAQAVRLCAGHVGVDRIPELDQGSDRAEQGTGRQPHRYVRAGESAGAAAG